MNNLYGDAAESKLNPSVFDRDAGDPDYTDHTEKQDPVKESAVIGQEPSSKKGSSVKNPVLLKKPMSLRNKIIIGTISVVIVAFGAALMTTASIPSPRINISPNMPGNAPTNASENVPDAHANQSQDAMIMNSSDANARDATQGATQHETMPPESSGVNGVASGSVPTSVVPVIHQDKQDKPVTEAVGPDPAILSRVNELERMNKEIEQKLELLIRKNDSASKPVKKVVRTRVQRSARSNVAKAPKIIKTDSVPDIPKMAVTTGAAMRIVGVTAKPGGATAVIESYGEKKRYERGDVVPGLGRITKIGIENGASLVEISGVTYH